MRTAEIIGACLIATIATAACGRDARDTTDSVAGAVAAPGMVALDEVAGTWNVRTIPDSAAEAVVVYVLAAKADTSGWTVTFPGREAVPVRAWAQGDSVIVEGTYEGGRGGAQEATHTVLRLHGDSLVGTAIARRAAGADSVVRRRVVATRVP